jgi:hypothetical protein
MIKSLGALSSVTLLTSSLLLAFYGQITLASEAYQGESIAIDTITRS